MKKNLNQRINDAFVEIESRIQRGDIGTALNILHRVVNKEIDEKQATISKLADALDKSADITENASASIFQRMEYAERMRELAAQYKQNK